jgi:hypothetical protein
MSVVNGISMAVSVRPLVPKVSLGSSASILRPQIVNVNSKPARAAPDSDVQPGSTPQFCLQPNWKS